MVVIVVLDDRRGLVRPMALSEAGMTDTIVVTELSKWFGLKVAVSELTIGFQAGRHRAPGPKRGRQDHPAAGAHRAAARRRRGRCRSWARTRGPTPRSIGRIALVPEDESVYDRLTGRQFVDSGGTPGEGRQRSRPGRAAIEDGWPERRRGSGSRRILQGDEATSQGGPGPGLRPRGAAARRAAQRRRPGAARPSHRSLPQARRRREDGDRFVPRPRRSGADDRSGGGHGRWAPGSSRGRWNDPRRDDRQAAAGLRRGERPRRLAGLLIVDPGVVGVSLDGNTVHVEASDAGDLARQAARSSRSRPASGSAVSSRSTSHWNRCSAIWSRVVDDSGAPPLPATHAPGPGHRPDRPGLGARASSTGWSASTLSRDELTELYTDILATVGYTYVVAALILTAATLREEKDSGTLPYIYLRPISRFWFAAQSIIAGAGRGAGDRGLRLAGHGPRLTRGGERDRPHDARPLSVRGGRDRIRRGLRPARLPRAPRRC